MEEINQQQQEEMDYQGSCSVLRYQHVKNEEKHKKKVKADPFVETIEEKRL